MTATQTQLEAVLAAADNLLLARQHDMLTVEECVALARAVAACTGRKTVDLLTPRDREEVADYSVLWNEATDGTLPDED